MENQYAMARGSVLRIEDGRDMVIVVEEGSLWLTQEGDPRDRYLGTGDWFRLDRDGLAVAHATSRSTVEVYAAPKESRSFWTRLFAPYSRPNERFGQIPGAMTTPDQAGRSGAALKPIRAR